MSALHIKTTKSEMVESTYHQKISYREKETMRSPAGYAMFSQKQNFCLTNVKERPSIKNRLVPGLAISLGLMTLSATSASADLVKICKVAGEGVEENTEFTFNVDASDRSGIETVIVKAGPAPGGYCWPLLREVENGATALITEVSPPGYTITDIIVEPAVRKVADEDGGVRITAGPGVTEVTFVNERRYGFLEICKTGGAPGDYTFAIGGLDIEPITVPSGACSPAIEVPAGDLTIVETTPGAQMTDNCRTIPANRQQECRVENNASIVSIVPGDISTQTIAFIDNRGGDGVGVPVDGSSSASRNSRAALDTNTINHTAIQNRFSAYAFSALQVDPFVTGSSAAAINVSCTPASSTMSTMAMCTAKVTGANNNRKNNPTGMVRFLREGKTLAILPLKTDGTTTLAIPRLLADERAISVIYGGDVVFKESASTLPE